MHHHAGNMPISTTQTDTTNNTPSMLTLRAQVSWSTCSHRLRGRGRGATSTNTRSTPGKQGTPSWPAPDAGICHVTLVEACLVAAVVELAPVGTLGRDRCRPPSR